MPVQFGPLDGDDGGGGYKMRCSFVCPVPMPAKKQ